LRADVRVVARCCACRREHVEIAKLRRKGPGRPERGSDLRARRAVRRARRS
jgi:hypothetical protein